MACYVSTTMDFGVELNASDRNRTKIEMRPEAVAFAKYFGK